MERNSVTGQRGATIPEFALAATFFFMLVLGVMELGRVLYVWNTAQEATRRAARAAAVTDFTSSTAMDAVRRSAVFRTSAGALIAAPEITDANVAIGYLNGSLGTVDASTTCPTKNVSTCLADPSSGGCIQFVRVQICQAGTGVGSACVPVNYAPLVGLFSAFGVAIPPSTVVMPAESLGFRPSAPSC